MEFLNEQKRTHCWLWIRRVSAKTRLLEVANTLTLQALATIGQAPYFVFASSSSLFAENQGNIVDESSVIEITPFSKRYLNSGEELVRNSSLATTIVRFSGIYGPGRNRPIEQVKPGTAQLKRNPCISNRTHMNDCAGILHRIANLQNREPLFISSDSEPIPYNEVLTRLAQETGHPIPQMEDEPKPSAHMSNKRCSNKLLQDSGYVFRFPNFRKGFRSCL